MGPTRSLTGMIDDVNEHTGMVLELTRRVREANRRLTGNCAFDSMPQAVGSTAPDRTGGANVDVLPTLTALTLAIGGNGSALSELREEVAYMESYSETGDALEKIYTGGGGVGSNGYDVDSIRNQSPVRGLRA